MSSLVAPQPPPAWKHTPEEVLLLTNKAIEQAKLGLDKIAALDSKDCTFESVGISLTQSSITNDWVAGIC